MKQVGTRVIRVAMAMHRLQRRYWQTASSSLSFDAVLRYSFSSCCAIDVGEIDTCPTRGRAGFLRRVAEDVWASEMYDAKE
jgi:hypothetical protein